MDYRRALPTAWRGGLWAGVLLAPLCGCAMLPPNSLIDPTKVGRFAVEVHESGILRVLTARDTPPGLAHATEPTLADLAPTYDEYRVGPGDTLGISINDLIVTGQPFSLALEVSTLGEIRLPELGTIRVSGMTEREIELELMARLKESGLLPRPVVMVFTQLRRGRTFSIIGGVTTPGTYGINEPDLRLLDAVGMAGDIQPTSKRMYVIRRQGGQIEESAPELPPPPDLPPPDELIVPPPPEPTPPPSGTFMSGVGLGRQEVRLAGVQEPPPTRAELEDVLKPAPQTRPAPEGAAGTRPAFEPIIFDPLTGEKLAPPPPPPVRPAAEPSPPREGEPPPGPAQLEEPFDWEDVDALEFDQRVIAIDVSELKSGNPRQNIVVRDKDVINVPIDTGVFYMMGEVLRPGVYAFGGRDITMKQALAVSGGFSPLAWPQRSEIIRREPGTDQQITILVDLDAVFAGREPDFFLRDDDIVNIGTHIAAPFLYVIRNSFRFTYGFGFVYDRNFADQDAYDSRANPETVEELRRQRRGLSF